MPGKAVILQPRDRRILTELAVFRVADGAQLRAVGGFTSTSRANRRLLQLLKSGYLGRNFIATVAGGLKAIYRLSRKGAAETGFCGTLVSRKPDGVLVSDSFVQHQLLINEVHIALQYRPIPIPGCSFARWLSFIEPLSKAVQLIPDGYFEIHTSKGLRAACVEVDRGTESLRVWKSKTEQYLRLATSGISEKVLGCSQFLVLVVAHSERRIQSLRKVVAFRTEKLFRFATTDDIKRDSVWAPIWQRPGGNGKESLL